MIYEARYKNADFLVVVIRAYTADEAMGLAIDVGTEYFGPEFGPIELVFLDPIGPPGVLIEDAP